MIWDPEYFLKRRLDPRSIIYFKNKVVGDDMRRDKLYTLMLTFLIKIYQHITPFSGTCRYSPTCSEYTRQAITKHGTIRGLWMGLKRVLRCNPFFSGGVDPVK